VGIEDGPQLALPDLPGSAASRDKYTETEPLRCPSCVLVGGHLGGMTFWDGAVLNDWAHRWVDCWTEGRSDCVNSAMEESGAFQAIECLDRVGRVDRDRFMVLRAGSNDTMPPSGVGAAENLLAENVGYAGLQASAESLQLYLVGSVVIHELLKAGELRPHRSDVLCVDTSLVRDLARHVGKRTPHSTRRSEKLSRLAG
jgi:purine nucleoside permease